jgi:hypothetical protein
LVFVVVSQVPCISYLHKTQICFQTLLYEAFYISNGSLQVETTQAVSAVCLEVLRRRQQSCRHVVCIAIEYHLVVFMRALGMCVGSYSEQEASAVICRSLHDSSVRIAFSSFTHVSNHSCMSPCAVTVVIGSSDLLVSCDAGRLPFMVIVNRRTAEEEEESSLCCRPSLRRRRVSRKVRICLI